MSPDENPPPVTTRDSPWRRLRKWIGTLFAGAWAFAAVLYIVVFYFTCGFFPYRAVDEAKRHATEAGYSPWPGSFGTWVRGPNLVGRCEVNVSFGDEAKNKLIRVHLRRTYFFGGWEVLEQTVEDRPRAKGS